MSHKFGQAISYWILPVSGTIISCTMVKRLTQTEKTMEEWNIIMGDYYTKVTERISVDASDLSNQVQNVDCWNKLSIADQYPKLLEELNRGISDSSIPDGPDDDTNRDVGKTSEDPTTVPGIHDQDIVPSDAYVNMELGLPRGSDNALMHALVKIRKLDNDDKPIGTEHSNALIDTRSYEVEFIDGTTETLTSNIIDKNLLSQVNEEGHR